MNVSIAHKRLNEVLMVDSVNSTQFDFLATHVPFRTIKIKHGITTDRDNESISEEEIYSRYFESDDMYNKHQFIVVEGSSGSGKSHFIRWLYAKLSTSELNKDVVLLIKRNDNTLKSTIKQLLDIPEIKNIKNREAYERLVRANQTISEKKFKDSIYQSFIVEIKNEDKKDCLTSVQKKNLTTLLTNVLFEARMLSAGGPIDRIFHKIISSSGVATEDALFHDEDFRLDIDFCEDLRNSGADKKAIKMAETLISEEDSEMEKIVCSYLNSLVENVIQSCAGIESGDFQQIFKEIRQELYSQGKNLILLIEDITAFTGINQALLSSLEIEHTGLYEDEHLCRLLSVVGTTSEYYRQFRDNYRDRITMQITIEDGAIGNYLDDLYQFFAKYLNAMSLESSTLNEWYKAGAMNSDYPVHRGEFSWSESYTFEGKKLDLFPFTRQAIKNLYFGMKEHKTPRYILRHIIEPTVTEILYDKKHFLRFLCNKQSNLNSMDAGKIMSIVNNMSFADNSEDKELYKSRALAMIGFWGNGTFNSDDKSIAGIPREYFKEFNLAEFANSVGASNSSVSFVDTSSSDNSVVKPDKLQFPQKYIDTEKTISDWHYNNKPFFSSRGEVRDAVCAFVFASINWQQAGIPLKLKESVESSNYKLVAFERQDRAIERALLILKDTDETYNVLCCFNRWLYLGNKSWNYGEYCKDPTISVGNDIYTVTVWLEKHKREFIDAILGNAYGVLPNYIKCGMAMDICAKLLNNDIECHRLSDLSVNNLTISNKTKKIGIGHSGAWDDLLNSIYDAKEIFSVHDFIIGCFNIIQGVGAGGSKCILKYSLVDELLREIKKNRLVIDVSEKSKFPAFATIEKGYEDIKGKLGIVAKSELELAKNKIRELLAYWEFDENCELEESDIRDLLNDIKNFYNEAEQYGITVQSRKNEAEQFRLKAGEIARTIKNLSEDYTSCDDIDIICAFSSNPTKILNDLIAFLINVNNDVENVSSRMQEEKNAQIRKGVWSSDVDPRFASVVDSFNVLKGEM